MMVTGALQSAQDSGKLFEVLSVVYRHTAGQLQEQEVSWHYISSTVDTLLHLAGATACVWGKGVVSKYTLQPQDYHNETIQLRSTYALSCWLLSDTDASLLTYCCMDSVHVSAGWSRRGAGRDHTYPEGPAGGTGDHCIPPVRSGEFQMLPLAWQLIKLQQLDIRIGSLPLSLAAVTFLVRRFKGHRKHISISAVKLLLVRCTAPGTCCKEPLITTRSAC
jgi:hypothetical protein